MKYLMLIYEDEAALEKMSEPAQQEVVAAYMAYSQALAQAGVLAGADRLRPSNAATRVRTKAGKTEVLDGPYAESKEQLGGYFLIDVPDLDKALTWAARCPGAQYGTIELRPIWAM